jgi:hypothetical protein
MHWDKVQNIQMMKTIYDGSGRLSVHENHVKGFFLTHYILNQSYGISFKGMWFKGEGKKWLHDCMAPDIRVIDLFQGKKSRDPEKYIWK